MHAWCIMQTRWETRQTWWGGDTEVRARLAPGDAGLLKQSKRDWRSRRIQCLSSLHYYCRRNRRKIFYFLYLLLDEAFFWEHEPIFDPKCKVDEKSPLPLAVKIYWFSYFTVLFCCLQFPTLTPAPSPETRYRVMSPAWQRLISSHARLRLRAEWSRLAVRESRDCDPVLLFVFVYWIGDVK